MYLSKCFQNVIKWVMSKDKYCLLLENMLIRHLESEASSTEGHKKKRRSRYTCICMWKMHEKMNSSLSKCMTFCFFWTIENIIQAWIQMDMEFGVFFSSFKIERCAVHTVVCWCVFVGTFIEFAWSLYYSN